MGYKIIVDSCCELPENLQNDSHFAVVPLTLNVDEEDIVDDGHFTVNELLCRLNVAKSAHSACPSPAAYLEEIECDANHVYVITLSSKVSGSYNSARLAATMSNKENVMVIDSKSACAAQTLIALKIKELEDAGFSFDSIKLEITTYIDELMTYFVCDDLSMFKKSGRLSGIKAIATDILGIKPILGAVNGEILQISKQRGTRKALVDMANRVIDGIKDSTDMVLAITHCNCEDRADLLKSILTSAHKFKDVIILNAKGLSSFYLNEGGIVVAV